MRGFLLMVALIALPACAAETLDFVFSDAGGNQYHSTSIRADFDRHYPGMNYYPFLVLVEAPDMNDPLLKEQIAVLEHFFDLPSAQEAEALQLVFPVMPIPSPFSGGYTDGYHVPKNEAQRLAGNLKGFRVRVVSPTGMVLKQSDRVLSMNTIKQVLKNHTDAARSK